MAPHKRYRESSIPGVEAKSHLLPAANIVEGVLGAHILCCAARRREGEGCWCGLRRERRARTSRNTAGNKRLQGGDGETNRERGARKPANSPSKSSSSKGATTKGEFAMTLSFTCLGDKEAHRVCPSVSMLSSSLSITSPSSQVEVRGGGYFPGSGLAKRFWEGSTERRSGDSRWNSEPFVNHFTLASLWSFKKDDCVRVHLRSLPRAHV